MKYQLFRLLIDSKTKPKTTKKGKKNRFFFSKIKIFQWKQQLKTISFNKILKVMPIVKQIL
jgi:hypothetical protein